VTKLTPDRSRQWPVSDPDSVPTWAYTAQIRILEKKVVIYEEAKTFSRKGAAEKWARARQVALEDPATLAQARVGATGKLTLSSLIKWYREAFRPLANCGRNKEESLKRLERIRSAVKTPSPSTARAAPSSSRGAE